MLSDWTFFGLSNENALEISLLHTVLIVSSLLELHYLGMENEHFLVLSAVGLSVGCRPCERIISLWKTWVLCVCKLLRRSHGSVCAKAQVIYVLREYCLVEFGNLQEIRPIRSLASKLQVRRGCEGKAGRNNKLESTTKARVQYFCASDCSDHQPR